MKLAKGIQVNSAFHSCIKCVAGIGSNIRVEFIALWVLLKASKEKEIKNLQAMGDLSKAALILQEGTLTEQVLRRGTLQSVPETFLD